MPRRSYFVDKAALGRRSISIRTSVGNRLPSKQLEVASCRPRKAVAEVPDLLLGHRRPVLARHLRKIFGKHIDLLLQEEKGGSNGTYSRSSTTKICVLIGSYCSKGYSIRLRLLKANSWPSRLQEQPSGLIEITGYSFGTIKLPFVLLANGIARRNGQDACCEPVLCANCIGATAHS